MLAPGMKQVSNGNFSMQMPLTKLVILFLSLQKLA